MQTETVFSSDEADARLDIALVAKQVAAGSTIESCALVLTLPDATVSVKAHASVGHVHFDTQVIPPVS